MKSFKNSRRACLSAMLATSMIAFAALPAVAATAFSWNATANLGSLHNELHSVAVASATQFFAVGESFNGTWDQPLILKGTTSSVCPSPPQPVGLTSCTTWTTSSVAHPLGSTHNQLWSVAMSGSKLGLAVGEYSLAKKSYPLVYRFSNGSWSLMNIANPLGIVASSLHGVAIGSATSAFAVGDQHALLKASKPFTEFFNGRVWKSVAVPNPGVVGTRAYTASLASVTVIPGTLGKKFMAVGTYSNGHDTMPFFDSWNGLAWKQIKFANTTLQIWLNKLSPTVQYRSPVSSTISSVTALAPNNMWAVGYYTITHLAPTPPNNHTFTIHFNGSTWTPVDSPNRNSANTPNELTSVSSRGLAVYAVGYYFGGLLTPGTEDQTQALVWNTAVIPHAWTKITSDSPSTLHSVLEGIAMLPVKGAVSVGTTFNGSSDRSLAQYCKDC